jgi:hypothetical protein
MDRYVPVLKSWCFRAEREKSREQSGDAAIRKYVHERSCENLASLLVLKQLLIQIY